MSKDIKDEYLIDELKQQLKILKRKVNSPDTSRSDIHTKIDLIVKNLDNVNIVSYLNVEWYKNTRDDYMLCDNMAVYGLVYTKENNADKHLKFKWEARVIIRATIGGFGHDEPIMGYADTIENAKKIVYSLCKNTNTFIGQTVGD